MASDKLATIALTMTIIAASAGCKAKQSPRIYPFAVEISMSNGVVNDDCVSQKAAWRSLTTREFPDTWISPKDGEACLVPVDSVHGERLVLSSISCTRDSNITAELTQVTFSLFPAGSYPGIGATPILAMTPSSPSAALGFGTGLALAADLKGYIDAGGGAAHCTIVGYYTSETGHIAPPRASDT